MIPFASDSGSGFTLSSLTTALLVGSAILIVCVAAVRLSSKTGLPSLLLYLGVGLLAGESAFGIDFESQQLTQVLGYAALILILTEGGLSTRWEDIKRSIAPAGLLATLGVVVSIFVVAAAGRLILGWSWSTALLVGAILSSTDAAAVFSVLRNVPLPHRLTGVLEAEAGFNDAPVVILVTSLSVAAANPDKAQSAAAIAGTAALELIIGTAVGLICGYLGGLFMRRVASDSSGLFAIGVVGFIVLTYAVAASAHASGFIACYLAALVLGNLALPHRAAVHAFATALGWLAHIGLFVLLGLLASPSEFGAQVVPAIVIGLVLLLLARPLSVAVSVSWFRLDLRDQAFLSWAGLRGAVPVVLATVPVTARAPNVSWIFDLVFVLVVIFTLIQGPTLPAVARWLKVTEEHKAREMSVETTPLDDIRAQLLHVDVGPASRLHGVAIFELRLPVEASVTLIVRDGQGFVPNPRTPIRHGDQLLIVTTDAARAPAEDRVRSVSRHGRLAEWSQPTPRAKEGRGAGDWVLLSRFRRAKARE